MGRKCWQGNLTVSCDSDKLYVARCSGTGLTPAQQAFRFVPVFNSTYDEVLIQSADINDQRCWERNKREIYLTECNVTNPLQFWWASNGTDFFSDENKFEISQIDFTKQCVSQDHHPKPVSGGWFKWQSAWRCFFGKVVCLSISNLLLLYFPL